jgi:hypothetical protein
LFHNLVPQEVTVADEEQNVPSSTMVPVCGLFSSEGSIGQKLGLIMEISPVLCFSCQHKDSLQSSKPPATTNGIVPDGTNCSVAPQVQKSQKKQCKLNDKYRALFFSEIWILIHSNLQHFLIHYQFQNRLGKEKNQWNKDCYT